MNKQDYKALEKILGKDHVTKESGDLLCYSYDGTQQSFMPDAVVFPENAEEVSQIMRLANDSGIPVFPRGAGSGLTGGSLPTSGGIVLSTERMNKILEIDTENLVARVEPAVVTGVFQKEVEKLGLFYPPDPASLAFSSLGGNVSENAGGPRCVKYGTTKDYILGLEVVTPLGDIINTGGQTMKGVVGYDLTKLICGSEGTLGVVTKITVRLLPLPEAKKTMLAMFDNIHAAARAVSTIIAHKIIPCCLEFIDTYTLDCIRKEPGMEIPESAKAVLLIEVDGDPMILEKQADCIAELLQGPDLVALKVAQNQQESQDIWKVRRMISPVLRKINPDKFNEDICVPRSKLPDMVEAAHEISGKHQVPIACFGHAGDGNIHVNIMVDKKIPGETEKALAAVEDIFRATLELGGTMSGEHGVGTAKAPYISMEINEMTARYMKTLKKALDPNNILNPGKIFLENELYGQDQNPGTFSAGH